MREKLGLTEHFFDLQEYHCTFRRDGERHYETCSATVKVVVGDDKIYTVAEGDGPVDALDHALRKALEPVFPELKDMQLQDYKVRIIDSHMGTASKTRVLIDSTDGEVTWSTVGVSYNIIAASWEALVSSVRYFLAQRRGEA